MLFAQVAAAGVVVVVVALRLLSGFLRRAQGAAAEHTSRVRLRRDSAPRLWRRPLRAAGKNVAGRRCAPCANSRGVSACEDSAARGRRNALRPGGAAALVHHRLPLELWVVEHAREALVDFNARLGLRSMAAGASAAAGMLPRCRAARLRKPREPRVAVHGCKARVVAVHRRCRLVGRRRLLHAAALLLLHRAALRARAKAASNKHVADARSSVTELGGRLAMADNHGASDAL